MSQNFKQMRIKLTLILIIISLFSYSNLSAQPKQKTRILFIFDSSQSMLGKWETGNKITIARKLLKQMVDSLNSVPNVELALRVYGHQSIVPPQDCSDTRLEVPFAENNANKIKSVLDRIRPKGTTPIAHSLELAAQDFPQCDNCRNIIILITDGIEACDGDPCAVSQALQKKGIILKPFVIGIGLDIEFRKSFECVGQYYDAADEKRFKEVLGVVISQALNNTSCQINLLDQAGNPTETNVNMTFTDKLSGKIKNNYIHTLNNRGVPDTIYLEPFITYKVKIHTIPPVYIDSLKLTPGKHSTFAVDAPQGYLTIKTKDINQKNVSVIVRKSKQMETLNVQKVNSTDKYIIGKYDVEILTLPRIKIDNIEIKQSYTTTLNIPASGIATFAYSAQGYGSVYLLKGEKMEWVCNLKTNTRKESINLQPGTYKVVFRTKNAKQTLFTKEKTFKVTSRGSILVRLF